MALYLLTKGIATGTMLVSLLLPFVYGDAFPLTFLVGPIISLLFLVITAALLVADLDRPERFYYILLRPNWRSWMVWGAYFLTAQGLLTTLWIALVVLGGGRWLLVLLWPLVVCSILTTGYTGFLFAQGLARDLWQGSQSTVDLFAQAIVEGSAVLLLASLIPGISDPRVTRTLAATLIGAMLVHVGLIVFENLVATNTTRHRQLAVDAIRRGAFARLFWGGAIAVAVASVVVALFVADAGRPGDRRRPRARRQLRLGIHLGRGGTERAALMTFRSTNPSIPTRPSGTTTSTSSRRAGPGRRSATTGSFRASASTASRPAGSWPTSTKRS